MRRFLIARRFGRGLIGREGKDLEVETDGTVVVDMEFAKEMVLSFDGGGPLIIYLRCFCLGGGVTKAD